MSIIKHRSLLENLKDSGIKNESPDILPLIDVVFLLLIFFVVTSTFVKHKHLNIDLPQVDNANILVTHAKEIMVGIDAHSNYTINGKYIADNTPVSLIAAIQSASNNTTTAMPLSISADAQAPYRTVIDVLNVVGKLGFVNIRLNVRDATDN